jgi:hypothetical protein
LEVMKTEYECNKAGDANSCSSFPKEIMPAQQEPRRADS